MPVRLVISDTQSSLDISVLNVYVISSLCNHADVYVHNRK